MMASQPQSLYLFQSNLSDGPMTRNTDTDVSATDFDALGPDIVNNLRMDRFHDIRGEPESREQSLQSHHALNTADLAHDLAVQHRPSLPSSTGLSAHIQPVTFPKSPQAACTEENPQSMCRGDYVPPPQTTDGVTSDDPSSDFASCMASSSQPSAPLVDAEPIKGDDSPTAGGASGHSTAYGGSWDIHQSGSPTPKVAELPFPAAHIPARSDTGLVHHIDLPPEAVKITGPGLNININSAGVVQIGNNTKQIVHTNGRHGRHGGPARVVTRDQPPKKKKLNVENRVVTDADFNVVVQELGAEWRRLGRALDLRKADMDAVEYDHRPSGLREITFQMLVNWRTKAGPDAKLRKLTEALLKIDKSGIAVKLAKSVN